MGGRGGSLSGSQGINIESALVTAEAIAGVAGQIEEHPETVELLEPMTDEERREWVRGICPDADNKKVNEIVEACKDYSTNFYRKMHNNNPDNDEGIQRRIDAVDALLNSKNAPIYKGNLYRGIKWVGKEEILNDIIASGVWTEPGITSFSTSLPTAKAFAAYNYPKDGIVNIILREKSGRNLSGVPFKHLSEIPSENEVLMPSSVRERGWNITSSKWQNAPNGGKYLFLDVEERTEKVP